MSVFVKAEKIVTKSHEEEMKYATIRMAAEKLVSWKEDLQDLDSGSFASAIGELKIALQAVGIEVSSIKMEGI